MQCTHLYIQTGDGGYGVTIERKTEEDKAG